MRTCPELATGGREPTAHESSIGGVATGVGSAGEICAIDCNGRRATAVASASIAKRHEAGEICKDGPIAAKSADTGAKPGKGELKPGETKSKKKSSWNRHF